MQDPAIGAGAKPSGHARSALRPEVHSDARASQHVHEGIDAEPVEATPHEIVHARLAYAQDFRYPSLGEPAARNPKLADVARRAKAARARRVRR